MTVRKLRAYEYILCQAFQAIPRETGAHFDVLHTLLNLLIDYASFVEFVLVLCSIAFSNETTTKA